MVFDWKENTSKERFFVILDLLFVIYLFEEKIKAFQGLFFMLSFFSVHPPPRGYRQIASSAKLS